jgi:hypothetical protein
MRDISGTSKSDFLLSVLISYFTQFRHVAKLNVRLLERTLCVVRRITMWASE